MSQKSVEHVIGKLATDEGLRREFERDPRAVLAGMVERGLELTECELWALGRVDPRELTRFAQTVDPRLQKSDLRCDVKNEASPPADRPVQGGL